MKSVTINGVWYESSTDASRQLGMSVYTIRWRCQAESYENYIMEDSHKRVKPDTIYRIRQSDDPPDVRSKVTSYSSWVKYRYSN